MSVHAPHRHVRSVRPVAVWAALSWLVLVLAAPPALAQKRGKEKSPPRVEWYDAKLEEAQREARERNVPILIAAVLEGEEASERFRDQLRDNRTLAKGLQRAVAILVNNGTHGTRRIEVTGDDGEEREVEVCAAFHTPTCETHQRNWDAVYLQYVASQGGDGSWPLPSAYVISPAGEIARRIYTEQPPEDDDMLDAVRDAARDAGPGITREELSRVRALAEDGRLMGRAKGWGEAWQAWSGVLAITRHGPFGTEAAAEVEKALAGMRSDLDAVLAKLAPDTIGEAYATLYRMRRTYAGSPYEKEVVDAVKDVERDPELKPLIAELKTELEAEQMWEDAHALLREGDEKGARRLLKRILARRYADTPAAERVREQYPDL